MEKSRPGRPFEKGQSGNPGGRPRIPDHVKEMLRAACAPAAKRLIEALDAEKTIVVGSGDAARMEVVPDWDLRLKAANSLLDRNGGKPTQGVTAEVGEGMQGRAAIIFLPAPEVDADAA